MGSKKQLEARGLTFREVELARSVFSERIDYSQVRVIDGKYTPIQPRRRIMAPNGNIYWPGVCADVASCPHHVCKDIFIHEMTHVMQHQQGLPVLWHGFLLHGARVVTCGLFNPYFCTVQPGKSFRAYNIEQQAVLAVEMLHGRYPQQFDV